MNINELPNVKNIPSVGSNSRMQEQLGIDLNVGAVPPHSLSAIQASIATARDNTPEGRTH